MATMNLKDRIIKYYSSYYKDALGLPNWKDYVRQRLGEERLESRKVQRLEKILNGFKGKKILNVGCGTGSFNVVAHKKGAHIFAIEPEPEAYEISSLKAKKAGIEPSYIKQAVAEKIPFPKEIFDIVYCFSVVEHVQNLEKSLKEMVRVLKPGGMLYMESRDYRGFYEGHYKMFWLPVFPKSIASIYLKLRGRNPDFLFHGIKYITLPKICKIILSIKPSAEIINLSDKPVRSEGFLNLFIWLYYQITGINPGIELVVKK